MQKGYIIYRTVYKLKKIERIQRVHESVKEKKTDFDLRVQIKRSKMKELRKQSCCFSYDEDRKSVKFSLFVR